MATFQCPQCNLTLTETDQLPQVCTGCGADLSELQKVVDWVPIARVSNLAEAGYLVDFLTARRIGSDITEENEFNAAAGAWYSSFVLRVAQENADAARSLLTTGEYGEEETSLDEHWQQVSGGGLVNSSTQFLKWALLLLVIAGVAAVILNDDQKPAPPGQPVEAQSFHEFLAQQPGPWIFENESGVRSYLYFNAVQNRLTVKQDLDGDGTLEYQRTFQAR
ncbi:MAG: hypothetical protein VB912_10285 [Pirellulaceae bacterium]